MSEEITINEINDNEYYEMYDNHFNNEYIWNLTIANALDYISEIREQGSE